MAKPRTFTEIRQSTIDRNGTCFGIRDLTRPRREIEQGGDPTRSIKSLYAEGRIYPNGRPHERPYGAAVPTPVGPSTPQFREDQPAKRNGNNVPNGWLRGQGQQPFFDHSKKGR